MIDPTSLPYRPCVGICLLNDRNEVFLGERIDTPGAWQMPQGGIDKGEDIIEAARRELGEEIGTDKMDVIALYDGLLRYDLPKTHKHLWKGRYRGQEQQWVYCRFIGVDSDVVLDGDDHPEFRQWKWCTPERTMDLIVPFKREVYEQVFAALPR